MSVRVIVGLGNPGARYAATRHNIGYQAIDRLAMAHGLSFDQRRFKALLADGQVLGQRVVLAKPETYMNASGEAVGPLVRWYKCAPEDLLVVYDDLDLPLGRLRLRASGSAGGHRGMESIIAALGTSAFPRLRIGIGRPPRPLAPAAYVLLPFSPDERPVIAEALERAQAAIECWLREGIAVAMNRYNC
jgi:PTH1 family peptidyl-tRNA hydrolase